MEQLKASFLGKMSVLKKKVSWCVLAPCDFLSDIFTAAD